MTDQTIAASAETIEALSDTLYDALYAITPFAEKYFADEREGLRDAVRAVLEQAAVLPAPADRAAGWLDAAAECNRAGGAYAERGANDAAGGAFALMETFLRKAGEAEYVATPCSGVPCEDGGEPCDVHERLMGHAEGDHELCAPDCGEPWMRRMADETATTETQARRGDAFAAWLKAQRDACFGHASSWAAVDGLLDQYRLHADTGTPLGEHVCEGQVVGDCECLEQPVAPVAPKRLPPMDPVHILGIEAADEPAAGARQDGAEQ